MTGNPWKILEESHAHTVLVLIRENPGILRSKLYNSVIGASRPTVQKRVDEMISAYLIRVERSKTHSAGQYLFLTDQGQQIAELTIEIERIIEDQNVNDKCRCIECLR